MTAMRTKETSVRLCVANVNQSDWHSKPQVLGFPVLKLQKLNLHRTCEE